jgi:hypothetical protein
MSDTNYPKTFAKGAVYPVHVPDPTGLLKRCEPLITPSQLKSRFLKGVMERLPAGVTFSDAELKDRINIAVNELEAQLGVNVFAETVVDKLPFDINLYKSFIQTRSMQKPICEVVDFAIVAADGSRVFPVPATWLDMSNAYRGTINVIPLLAAYGNNAIQAGSSNFSAFFATLFQGWVPSYWQLTYKSGVSKDAGEVPVLVNKLIGIFAAIEILSGLAANNIYNSQSLSQDGISQSTGSAGTQIYNQRMQDLEKQKEDNLKQLKRIFSNKMFMGTL